MHRQQRGPGSGRSKKSGCCPWDWRPPCWSRTRARTGARPKTRRVDSGSCHGVAVGSRAGLDSSCRPARASGGRAGPRRTEFAGVGQGHSSRTPAWPADTGAPFFALRSGPSAVVPVEPRSRTEPSRRSKPIFQPSAASGMLALAHGMVVIDGRRCRPAGRLHRLGSPHGRAECPRVFFATQRQACH